MTVFEKSHTGGPMNWQSYWNVLYKKKIKFSKITKTYSWHFNKLCDLYYVWIIVLVQREEQQQDSKFTCKLSVYQSQAGTQPISPSSCLRFSHVLRSNKSCSTSRICSTTTRSASPPPSVWLRTFWNCPTAAATSYWATWESTAWWSSTGPCTEMPAAPRPPTEAADVPPGLYVLLLSVAVLLWHNHDQRFEFIHRRRISPSA